jgi:energy-coupling factor transport system ATP-binding protein
MPIEVKNLCYSYKKGTPFEKKVLHDISLTVNDGEFLGLIGPTQAGKTTLAQHFNALLLPQSGKVLIGNCDTCLKDANLIALRQKVGYIFQNPDYQLFAPTVGEDVAFGPKNQGLSGNEVEERVIEAMTQVGLDFDTFKNRDIFALSGGQKRRAAVAGVLACRPQILILDDITAGLDPRGRDEILEVVKGLHQQSMITIIFISNSMETVARLADRLVVMDQGRIVMDGSTRDIFTRSDHLQEIGLEIPDIMHIAKQLREKGFNLPPALLNIEEAAESITECLANRQVSD